MTAPTDTKNPEDMLTHWRAEEAAVRARQTSNQELSENPTFHGDCRAVNRRLRDPTPRSKITAQKSGVSRSQKSRLAGVIAEMPTESPSRFGSPLPRSKGS